MRHSSGEFPTRRCSTIRKIYNADAPPHCISGITFKPADYRAYQILVLLLVIVDSLFQLLPGVQKIFLPDRKHNNYPIIDNEGNDMHPCMRRS